MQNFDVRTSLVQGEKKKKDWQTILPVSKNVTSPSYCFWICITKSAICIHIISGCMHNVINCYGLLLQIKQRKLQTDKTESTRLTLYVKILVLESCKKLSNSVITQIHLFSSFHY